MSTLLLRLAAPMQSWGVGSKFDTRMTEREPTKSGVLGLLAAALGIRRDDAQALCTLSALRFGVRVDREGKLLYDYHMAHEDAFWTTNNNKYSHCTHRYYLSDAVFLCGLESDDDELLERCAHALTHPAFPLFLGRRSCPPTLPLMLGIREGDLDTVLRAEPALCTWDGPVRIIADAGAGGADTALARDVPLSFSPLRREFGYRRYRELILPGHEQTEHDPFAELEAENVSDTNGA